MSDYKKDLQTCDWEIFNLWGDINDYLPDENGEYLEPWTIEDCKYLQSKFHNAANVILGTVMKDHCSYEIHQALNCYDSALELTIKHNDPSRCQQVIAECVRTFREIRIACQRAQKMCG